MTDKPEIWTDGACSGNPGPGGWGVVIKTESSYREMYGGDSSTTNNRMEMMAALQALESLPEGAAATLHTDSKYVFDGVQTWVKGWKKRGWKTADKKPVKNQDLWIALDEANTARKITWRWVRGHSGNDGNERADELARLGCEEARGG